MAPHKPVASTSLVPLSQPTARQRLLDMCSEIVGEGLPNMRRMMQRLYDEAHNDKSRDTARVGAARAYANYTLEAAKIAAEIEAGVTPGPGNEGTQINVLVMSPDGTSKAATAEDQKQLIAELTARLSAERAAPSK